eukprot:TRINITY_DN6685_c1_g1_i2.p1 TRINITY_DN6685_c1_g1~~TRINITY_DN6685_c1_g1_i2.p1  ORF type:complete len:354 (-),score=44.13 TRINITY_DN6685_c1_g1_i2:97-1047(-)
MVTIVAFHPYENLIVVANEKNFLSVWNWKENTRLNRFSNTNPEGSRITSLTLLNENSTLISAGSDDGVVRIWKGMTQQEPKLITAWKVLNDLPPVSSTGSAGLIVHWQSGHDQLMSSGNTSVIRVWDVSKELSVQDIPTNSDTFVTCLTSNRKEDGKLIVAGFSDGSIRFFDRRLSSRSGPIVTLTEHNKEWVVNVEYHHPTSQIISGSTTGVVKFWAPMATTTSLKSIYPTFSQNKATVMTALAVHESVSTIATGFQDQKINVLGFSNESLGLIRYHDGFLGQRIGPVSCLAFHPNQLLMAAGGTDSIVSIFSGQ